ncbi:hypothetical protein STRDD11_02533 [Streptococcus sp. DD11]|nr:hypothetical protein STRDD11_02533 [Streptococcus sp. DD11]
MNLNEMEHRNEKTGSKSLQNALLATVISLFFTNFKQGG